MKFRHLVSFTHICYLTVDYDVYQMSGADFSHFSLTTFVAFKIKFQNVVLF